MTVQVENVLDKAHILSPADVKRCTRQEPSLRSGVLRVVFKIQIFYRTAE